MWDDRFIFVLSALFGVSLWIVVFKRREAIKAGRQPRFAYGLLTLILVAIALILAIRYFAYSTDQGLQRPGLGLVLAFIIGGAVGSFSARFVWSLFGARFGARDPLIGVLALLLLVVVYSLPVYQREKSALLGHVGLSSLKTPIGELTFTERSRFQGAVVSAAKPSGEERSSALPRPSYPRPGLDALRIAVSEGPNDYLVKDARYIAYFDGRGDFKAGEAPPDDVMVATRAFLRPAKTLARCLRAYVDIIPDSQLLLVDVKPVIQFFFRVHANAVTAVRHGSDRPKDPGKDVAELYRLVEGVRRVVLEAIGSTRDAATETTLEADGTLSDPAMTVKAEDKESFADRCRADKLQVSAESTRVLQNFTYLQPYVTIALANLLVAHGSPDEAIDVITQWLNLWRCAHGEGADGKQVPAKCMFGPLPAEANKLPEWFRIRAEFELNVLLFQQAGEANITYRDYLRDHAEHFKNYAANPKSYDRRDHPPTATRAVAGISIREELERCQDRKTPAGGADAASVSNIRAIILRSLLQNEDTLLRSELHFLAGANWADMENLHERGLVLTRFSAGCIDPEGDEKIWKATIANYKITSGLLALAIADRLTTTAASVDERNRADEIKNEGKQQLRIGYRLLKEFRDADRKEIALLPWSERVFNVSQWEESCSLAERAIHQLNEVGP